jgi:hypothetical protein
VNLRCPNCQANVPFTASECPACGIAVTIESVQAYVSELDAVTGDVRIRIRDPRGSVSESHADVGQLSVSVSGTGGVGRESESRVAETLRLTLASSGVLVTIGEAPDDRGEDRSIMLDDKTFVLQITVAPSESQFWRRAYASSSTTQVDEQEAVQWLRTPIVDKAARIPIPGRMKTVLAIDVTHAGVLANQSVREEYVRQFGCPVAEFGFASVWVVGPSAYFCGRLGNGYP